MFILNNIAYAGTSADQMLVQAIRPLDDMMMLITFVSGEKRLYDASQLLSYPAFQALRDEAVFRAAVIDHGVVCWDGGDIDIAPETMYENSYAYEEMRA